MSKGRKRDYYEVLGVPRDADELELKRAFRDLARKFHPDVNAGQHAEDRFKEANEAYAVLSDPHTRARYDRHGFAGVGMAARPAGSARWPTRWTRSSATSCGGGRRSGAGVTSGTRSR